MTHLERGVACEIDLELAVGAPVLEPALVVGVVEAGHGGTVLRHDAVLRAPAVLHFLFDLADVHSLDVTELGTEVGAQVGVAREPVQVPAVASQLGEVTAPVQRSGRLELAGEGVDRLTRQEPVRGQLHAGIDREHSIEAGTEVPAGGQKPEARLAELTPHADDPVDRPVPPQGIGDGHELARGSIVGGQGARDPRARLARQAEAVLRVGDPAREEELGRGLEESRVLDEERPPLGEDDLVPLVDGHLRLVGFDLAEIGIERGIQRVRFVEHQLRVETPPELVLALQARPP